VTVAALGWLAGIVALQLSPALPGAGSIALLGILAGILALLGWRLGDHRQRVKATLLVLAALQAGYAWAGTLAHRRMADALAPEWERRDIELVGVVAQLPQAVARGSRVVFDVEAVLTPDARVPRRLLLAWYHGERAGATGSRVQTSGPQAGERWQLRVRLRRPHGAVNPHGFDAEAWLLERGLRAVGHVQRGAIRLDARVAGIGYGIERARESIRTRLLAATGEGRYAGVVVALAIGDGAAIPAAQWAVFSRAGITHLISISGLHVTLLAGLAGLAVDRLWRLRPAWITRVPARRAAIATALLVATAYALLAGFGVPARRTVCMLAVVALALWRAAPVRPGPILARAAAVVATTDPWAVLSVGFWLSFGAVAVLMITGLGAPATPARLRAADRDAHAARPVRALTAMARWLTVQWRMSIALVPATVALFQQVPLLGPVANAFAIPIIGTLAVPVAVVAAVLPVPGLPSLAHALVEAGLAPVEWLASRPWAVWTRSAPPVWSVGWALAGLGWWLLPAGWPLRRLALLGLLPLLTVAGARAPAPGSMELTVIDVGQGLAVLIRTAEGAVAYDTGPSWGGSDAGARIVAPLLRARGIRELALAVVSHDDSDHAGGAASLLSEVPVAGLLSSLPHAHPLSVRADASTRCHAGQRWVLGGVGFEVLHPHWDLYARSMPDNERSCVLALEASGTRVLIMGDAGERSEAMLLARGADLRADALVVAHHGAAGATSAALLAAMRPRLALISAGYRNRFGHPHPAVIARLRSAGAQVLRTDHSGALVLEVGPGGMRVRAWREERPRYWHDPPPTRTVGGTSHRP